MWVVTALALIGTVMNILRKRNGFAIWFVTNSAMTAYNWQHGHLHQALLFVAYAGLAAWGWCAWRRPKP